MDKKSFSFFLIEYPVAFRNTSDYNELRMEFCIDFKMLELNAHLIFTL